MLVLELLNHPNIGIFSNSPESYPSVYTPGLWNGGGGGGAVTSCIFFTHTIGVHTGLSSSAQFSAFRTGIPTWLQLSCFPLLGEISGPLCIYGFLYSSNQWGHKFPLYYLRPYKLSYLCHRCRMLKIWSSSFQSDIFAGLPSVWTANSSGSPHLSRQ